jgi:hypothetical protein
MLAMVTRRNKSAHNDRAKAHRVCALSALAHFYVAHAAARTDRRVPDNCNCIQHSRVIANESGCACAFCFVRIRTLAQHTKTHNFETSVDISRLIRRDHFPIYALGQYEAAADNEGHWYATERPSTLPVKITGNDRWRRH